VNCRPCGSGLASKVPEVPVNLLAPLVLLFIEWTAARPRLGRFRSDTAHPAR
jgi:hypothetical protein